MKNFFGKHTGLSWAHLTKNKVSSPLSEYLAVIV